MEKSNQASGYVLLGTLIALPQTKIKIVFSNFADMTTTTAVWLGEKKISQFDGEGEAKFIFDGDNATLDWIISPCQPGKWQYQADIHVNDQLVWRRLTPNEPQEPPYCRLIIAVCKDH